MSIFPGKHQLKIEFYRFINLISVKLKLSLINFGLDISSAEKKLICLKVFVLFNGFMIGILTMFMSTRVPDDNELHEDSSIVDKNQLNQLN